jgi:outer membrane protein assembly factor BamD
MVDSAWRNGLDRRLGVAVVQHAIQIDNLTSGTHSLLKNLRSIISSALLLAIVAGAISLAGCAKSSPGDQVLGPEVAWQKAKNLFAREKYLKAQQILKDITLNYSGAAIIDSVQFLLGRTYYELDEYLTAADQFHKMVEQYPQSALGGDASYWESRCYYEQAPGYQLDQDNTTKALQGFQRFLEEHPQHAMTDSAYKYLSLCRDKLAHKEYAAAKLYYDLGEFASSVLYADVVLANYYDTSWAGPSQFLKGRSFFDIQDWTRSQKELQAYVDKYPSGQFVLRAREMIAAANKRLNTATRPPQP